MDFFNRTAHKTENLQKLRRGKVFNAVLRVYENHDAFKCDENSGSLDPVLATQLLLACALKFTLITFFCNAIIVLSYN